MTKNLDENIKRQLGKKMTHFFKYFPVRIKNVGEEAVAARKLVWNFKDAVSEATEKVAQMTAHHLTEEFGEELSNMVFVSVPASSQKKNDSRYRHFCHRISELTGMANGYEHIKVLEDRLAVHEHGRKKSVSTVSVLDLEADFFKGKKIALFDDIVTTGGSWATLASKLEELGANVVEGIFLGKTSYKYDK